MISMIQKICTHCYRDVDKCNYQKQMRNFGLGEYADIFTREVEIPWTSSNGSAK